MTATPLTRGQRPEIGDSDKIIAANLRCIRKARTLTLEGFATLMGISWQQCLKYENAQNRLSISRLIQCAQVLEVEIKDLLRGTGAMSKPPTGPGHVFAPVSLKAMELAHMHDAITDPRQRTALRNMARTMAQAED